MRLGRGPEQVCVIHARHSRRSSSSRSSRLRESPRRRDSAKNKVQYETLQWSVLETPHVRLHFYAQEESLARRLAAFAESVCVEYDGRFQLNPIHHVPFLLYSAHYLFQQTNATPELITESVGGLTELVKGRVLIPHNGSWARLRWVTRHELTHWYMLEKISAGDARAPPHAAVHAAAVVHRGPRRVLRHQVGRGRRGPAARRRDLGPGASADAQRRHHRHGADVQGRAVVPALPARHVRRLARVRHARRTGGAPTTSRPRSASRSACRSSRWTSTGTRACAAATTRQPQRRPSRTKSRTA